ncbi:MAG: NAD-dependent DNA ligase LigA [Lachnospiraceae bacterium]|nr:NAD-dependent DNA ligase LigA [Lachnospiraceae bacterium]MDY4971910.1 NAD-dependent DNA ligase LigA [Lachnospiraceae bacterium]
MKELIEVLNRASKAYYQENTEIMSNLEYDALYDELAELEKQTGIVMASSPTIHVGYELLTELPRESHASPMLSLDKTKSASELRSWLNGHEGILSWKLDGLTIVLTYRGGRLEKAVTRGNGEVGEVITSNAKTFVNVPLQIAFRGELVLRGEAVIPYSTFNRINHEIEDVDARYKNPRNLCSGSVRQLNSEITAARGVHFYAFNLVSAEGMEFISREKQFEWLAGQGFDVVEHVKVTPETVEKEVLKFAERISDMDVPSDGLVLIYEDIAYGNSLGRTAKFPRDSIAFKWADETAETTLRYVEWSASRTGLINPVAVFDPVQLEGTTVSRASVHNLSIVESLALGEGDRITVYKANMIIPQIAENLTGSASLKIPEICPVCGGKTEIRTVNEAKSLYCTNPACAAKKIKSLALFVSRDAMNIDGLSEATLEKLTAAGMIHSFADLYHLDRYREQIVEMEGMGEKSYEKLMASIDRSRKTTISRVIYSLGMEGVGPATARLICGYFDQDPERIASAAAEELVSIEGIGPVTAAAVESYFSSPANLEAYHALLEELRLEKEVKAEESVIAGKIFVITGSLNHYANRNALKAEIEQLGGKVTGSVTSKTDYLINNDVTSGSSKNKKARELQIPILSEDDFIAMIHPEN